MFVLPILSQAPSAPLTITVQTDGPRLPVSPDLYGVFFEEINQAGDGGIYAELLRNRGFEGEAKDGALPAGWSVAGSGTLDRTDGLNAAHPASLALASGATATNEGFWGVPTVRGARYRLVVWAKGSGALEARLGRAETRLLSGPGVDPDRAHPRGPRHRSEGEPRAHRAGGRREDRLRLAPAPGDMEGAAQRAPRGSRPRRSPR